MYHWINKKFKGRLLTLCLEISPRLICDIFPPTFDPFSHFESAEFSAAKVVSVESEMMKQEKPAAFCYNSDIGQNMDFNILIQDICIYPYLSIFQGSTSPSVMRMGTTSQVSAMEA